MLCAFFVCLIKSLDSSKNKVSLQVQINISREAFLNVDYGVNIFGKFFRFYKPNIEYWVGKQAIVHLGVFGLDIIIKDWFHSSTPIHYSSDEIYLSALVKDVTMCLS